VFSRILNKGVTVYAVENQSPHHVVIIGGGFGGLYAAKALSRLVSVTLVDKRNFHLFQPLLYQVATGTPLIFHPSPLGSE